MPLTICGKITIIAGFDQVGGWQWNLAEIDPCSVFGCAPIKWNAEWDSCDTGDMTPEQYFSFAEFLYHGPLPVRLVNYLLIPDVSETTIDEIVVKIEKPTLTDIEYLERKLQSKLPNLNRTESYFASMQFSSEKIVETLRIEREDDCILDRIVETEIINKRLESEGTLFISNMYGLSHMPRGKSREEIQSMVMIANDDETRTLAAYVSSEFNDIEWFINLLEKADHLLQEKLYIMRTPEEHDAYKEGYNYARKFGKQSRSKDCPYSAETAPKKNEAWVSGFWDFFYP